MTSISGKTLGILGLGKLGVAFAKIGVQAFGMKVIAWSENLDQVKADTAAKKADLPQGTFKAVSKKQLLEESDVLSLHNVLSDRSRGIIDTPDLDLMKPSAIILNTSRGPLIDQEALIQALKNGKIKGFATDVFWEEPLPADSPWRSADSWSKGTVVLSPHMGYVNEGTINRFYEEQAEIMDLYLKGEEVLNKLN